MDYPTWIGFRPKRHLLDPNFESYRLALEPLRVDRQKLKGTLKVPELSTDEYGLNHVQLRANFNGLFHDKFSPTSVFYPANGQIYHIKYVEGKLSEPQSVYRVELGSSESATNIDLVVSFVSSDYAMISTSEGSLFLLLTEDRSSGNQWKLVFEHKLDFDKAPVLTTSLRTVGDEKELLVDILVCYITKNDKALIRKSLHFITNLEWITLTGSPSTTGILWKVSRTRSLIGTSVPKYASFRYQSLMVAAESHFKFVRDEPELPTKPESPVYSYIQSPEDVTVVFKLGLGTRKEDISVRIEPSFLDITVDGRTAIRGELEGLVDSCSTWSAADGYLEVVLIKAGGDDHRWKGVVKDDLRGEEVFDPEYIEDVHERLKHLTSSEEEAAYADYGEMEDCDLSETDFHLVVLNGVTYKEENFSNITGHQFLFKVDTAEECRLVLRHDVDGIVWAPRSTGKTFDMEHVATFNAFGYVSASKQDRQYVVAGPSLKYVALIDNRSHVYIYGTPTSPEGGELKNRKTGEVQNVAKQHLVRLEECAKIIGAAACDECIFVLGEDCLYAVEVL